MSIDALKFGQAASSFAPMTSALQQPGGSFTAAGANPAVTGQFSPSAGFSPEGHFTVPKTGPEAGGVGVQGQTVNAVQGNLLVERTQFADGFDASTANLYRPAAPEHAAQFLDMTA